MKTTRTKEQLTNILLAPHVSEKSARVADEGNQFVFRVRKDATRTHVKQAVELMFDVKVAIRAGAEPAGQEAAFRRDQGPALRIQEGVRTSGRGPDDRLHRVEGLSRGT